MITSDASYVLMCHCCFLADNLEICPTNNTRMSYSLFAWIPVKFCSDLPVKRCAADRDWLSQLLLLFLMQYEKVCKNLDTWVWTINCDILLLTQRVSLKRTVRGSSLISRRLHYRGLQSLFLTNRKELWLCASERFRMRSGMPQGIVVMREWEDLGCTVRWRKDLWFNGWFRIHSEPCAFLSLFSLFAFILQIFTRVSKR